MKVHISLAVEKCSHRTAEEMGSIEVEGHLDATSNLVTPPCAGKSDCQAVIAAVLSRVRMGVSFDQIGGYI